MEEGRRQKAKGKSQMVKDRWQKTDGKRQMEKPKGPARYLCASKWVAASARFGRRTQPPLSCDLCLNLTGFGMVQNPGFSR